MTRSGVLIRAGQFAAVLLLAGCGFHPLYGTAGATAGPPRAELATIDVAIIPDRPGQILRQALQQRLDHGEALAKHYTLNVSFGVAGDAISIQRDTTATRVREVATATWSLKALDPGAAVVASGTARALDGVNIIDQQYFAADLEGDTATRRITESVADQITQQLASFFSRRAQRA